MSKENKEKPKIKIEQRTLRGEIAKWQTKEETPKEDIKELEAEAASEDLEFKKWEEKYVDAKYNLEEFIDFIKNHNLEAGQEEAVKDLKARSAELRNLLKNKNYENFKIKHNEFDDILESLYPPTPLEEKKDVFGKDITRLKSVDLKLKSTPTTELSPESAPVVPEIIKPAVVEIAPSLKTAPEAKQPPAPPSPPEKKKSLWGRIKESIKTTKDAVFNRETGKAAGKMSYDTITSVLGIKLITDIIQGWTGKGDLAQWWKGRKESQASKEAITEAYQLLMQAFKKSKRGETLAESETIEKRLVDFKAQVESAHVSPEVKKELLDRLLIIGEKHQEDTETAVKARNTEVRRVLEAYVQGKISGTRIARDAMNFALTAAGMSLLRGIMYAGVSIAERAGKARKEYTKRGLKENSQKTELAFVAKDVLVNATLETARALTLRGEKEGANKKTKTIDFIKAIGTVARGFGIYGLAISGSDSTEQSIDKLINGIKEQGVAGTISHNFIQNAERVGHLAVHPTEIFTGHENLAPEPIEYHEIPAAPEHPVIPEHHEVPIPTEAVEHGDHTVAVEVLNNKEGILHGVNRIIHDNPNVFTHTDGKAWTANEIHLWKVHELKEMGFKIEGDKWGYPMTVHAGAQVEVFTDEQGQPHFKLASEEHVTFNKNYKWVDTEHHPAKTGTVESLSKDDLINPYPDSHEIKAGVESVVDRAQITPTNMAVEHAAMPKSVKVDLDIKDKAIVHHAPAVAPEAAEVEVKETASQFLTERGSNPKEFIAVYDKMVDGAIDRLEDSLIFRGGADKFLQSRIDALYNTGMIQGNIAGVDSRSFALMEKILNAEDKFKLNQPDWLKTFSQTMFDKSDKAMRLALLPDRDVLLEPIKTNGGHAARIWDEVEGKDVFIYDKDRIFNTNDDGRLIMEDEHGVIKLLNQKQALKMSEKELSE